MNIGFLERTNCVLCRLSVGALVGIPRISPDVDLAFDTYIIPKGVSSPMFIPLSPKQKTLLF